jgi:hypothetical protein
VQGLYYLLRHRTGCSTLNAVRVLLDPSDFKAEPLPRTRPLALRNLSLRFTLRRTGQRTMRTPRCMQDMAARCAKAWKSGISAYFALATTYVYPRRRLNAAARLQHFAATEPLFGRWCHTHTAATRPADLLWLYTETGATCCDARTYWQDGNVSGACKAAHTRTTFYAFPMGGLYARYAAAPDKLRRIFGTTLSICLSGDGRTRWLFSSGGGGRTVGRPAVLPPASAKFRFTGVAFAYGNAHAV